MKSMAHLVRGWHLAYIGEWNEAIRDYAEAAEVAWQAGDLRSWGSATFGQSVLYCQQGRLQEAWDLTKRIMKNGQDSGDRVGMRAGLLIKGMILHRLDRLYESETALRDGFELARRDQDLLISTHTAAEMATCLAKQHRFDEAKSIVHAAESWRSEAQDLAAAVPPRLSPKSEC